MKREAVVVEQKKVAGIVYGVLVLAAVFALGWFSGNNRVPSAVQVTVSETIQPAATVPKPTASAPVTAVSVPEIVDLNTADQAALETLPNIGPELASRILAYRETIGAFVTKEQIMDVEGIGEKRFADMEQLITVGGTP